MHSINLDSLRAPFAYNYFWFYFWYGKPAVQGVRTGA